MNKLFLGTLMILLPIIVKSQASLIFSATNYNSISGVYVGGEAGINAGNKYNGTAFYMFNVIARKELYGINNAFIINPDNKRFNLALGCRVGIYDKVFGVLMPYIDQRMYLSERTKFCIAISAERAIPAIEFKVVITNFEVKKKLVKNINMYYNDL